MKNITITLDEHTAAWVRRFAAEHDTSVSRLVGDLLRTRMRELDDYDTAMRRYLEKAPVALKRKSARYPARESLHDRDDLR
jgi:hypothetical protein